NTGGGNTGDNQIAAFSTGGSTYVVTDDAGATLATDAAGSHANEDSIINLLGVSSIAGFGATAAANTVVVTDVTNLVSSSANTGTAMAQVYNDAGAALETLGGIGGNTPLNQTKATSLDAVQSYTFNNLAASAELDVDASLAPGPDIGDVVVTQIGAAGNNSLTVKGGADTTTIDKLTLSGDALVAL